VLDACLAFIALIVEPTLSRGDDATCNCTGDQLQGIGRLRGRLSCGGIQVFTDLSVIVQAQHPSLLQNFQEFEAQAAGKRVAVFLDYDGGLLPDTIMRCTCRPVRRMSGSKMLILVAVIGRPSGFNVGFTPLR